MKAFVRPAKTSIFRFDLDSQPQLSDLQHALFSLFGEKNSQAKLYWHNPSCDARFRLLLSEGANGKVIGQLDLYVGGGYLPVWTTCEQDLAKLCISIEDSSREAEKIAKRIYNPFIDATERRPMSTSGVDSCFVAACC